MSAVCAAVTSIPEHSITLDRNPCLLVGPLHNPGLALLPWGRLFDASCGRCGFKRRPPAPTTPKLCQHVSLEASHTTLQAASLQC